MLPVLRRSPWLNPAVEGQINRLESFFDRVFDDFAAAAPALTGVPVAMWDDDDHIYVEAELPGVAEADVDITVHNGMLFIRCERKAEEGRNYLYNGRAYGRFERVLTLPETVDTDNIQANLANGVLHITLPKSPETKPRKITVQRKS